MLPSSSLSLLEADLYIRQRKTVVPYTVLDVVVNSDHDGHVETVPLSRGKLE